MKSKLISGFFIAALAAGAVLSAGALAPEASFQNVRFSFADKHLSDDSIHDLVKRKLANDPDVKGGALDIDVKDGVVTLHGKVETDKLKQKAERLTKKITGVKKVVNEIQLSTK
ncbi:MAG TPA: BON domain-containing protein [Bryobacteraceae bacterium]|nr:BON domain-containing protein [Bryobacteraceae bacterium]